MISKLQSNRVRRTYRGGARIDALTGFAPTGDGACRPEDWLASTTTAFNGTVEIEGEGLGRLQDGRLVKDVVGTLPILVKLLDSDERLVIQAHPTVSFARARMNSSVGKTECWYFLPGTDPDACVYLGFKPGITRDQWTRAVTAAVGTDPATVVTATVGTDPESLGTESLGTDPESLGTDPRKYVDKSQKLLDLLHKVHVKAGDFVFVDGGVPHAIGEGCFLIELQEPSDLMVVAERFTPSGRRVPDAKIHGGLGFDEMFDVYSYNGIEYGELCQKYIKLNKFFDLNLGSVPNGSGSVPNGSPNGSGSVPNGPRRILGPELTDKFELWEVGGGGAVSLDGAGAVVIVTGGEGALNGLPVHRGDRLVVSGESSVCGTGALQFVVCFQRVA